MNINIDTSSFGKCFVSDAYQPSTNRVLAEYQLQRRPAATAGALLVLCWYFVVMLLVFCWDSVSILMVFGGVG